MIGPDSHWFTIHTEQYKQSIYDILSPTKSEEEFRQKLKSIRF